METDRQHTGVFSRIWRWVRLNPLLAIPTFCISSITAIVLICNSFTIVDEGERAVQLKFGQVVDVLDPGLHFKAPFISSFKEISTRTYQFKPSIPVEAYSNDKQPATMTVSVNYRVPAEDVRDLYVQYKDLDSAVYTLLSNKIQNVLENTFGQYTSTAAIQQREQLSIDYANNLRKAIDGPIEIVSVQIENIDFSDAYEKSIEGRMMAEVAIQTEQQNLDRAKVSAQIKITTAQAEADAELLLATTKAQSLKLQGEAEANSMMLKGAMLQKYPELVKLTGAEKWNGALPTSMYPGSTVPFIELK